MRTITVTGGRIIHVQPSPRARRLFWHLLGLSRVTVTESKSVGAFALPGATIHWVERGRSEIRLSSGTVELTPGPHFVIYAMQQDRHFRPLNGRPYTGNTIRFGGPNLGALLDELEVRKNPVFHVDPPGWVYRLKRDLSRLATEQSPGWETRIHLLLSESLCRFLEIRKPSRISESNLPQPIGKIFDAIATDPDRAWKVADLATLSGMSYSRLRILFQETLHESLHSYLQNNRLDRARILLAEGKLSVKEIAAKLHFGNEYYLSSFFKTRTGYSPTDFRKHLAIK